MKYRYVILALAVFAYASCAHVEPAGSNLPEYVRDIISGKDTRLHSLVTSYNPDDRSKSLFVLGPMERSLPAIRALMTCDRFDNVDGRRTPDGLPDFAGESLCAIYDIDYSGINESGELRRATVRSVIQAMDTVCFVSPYDKSGLGRKPGAKLVLLTSPRAALSGMSDVDTLLTALSCNMPVICPMKIALEPFFAQKKKSAVIAVIGDSAEKDLDAYPAYVQSLAAKAGMDTSACFVRTDSTAKPLLSLLDAYAASGASLPIDMLLVDNHRVDANEIRAELARVRSVMNEESFLYGNLVSRDFKVVDLAAVGAESCFTSLRRRNLFTHKVAYPTIMEYMSVSSPADSIKEMLLQYNTKYLH